MHHVPTTSDRVARNTAQHVNDSIRAATEKRIRELDGHTHAIDRRLAELDREWDIERALEANAAALALTGVVLGTTRDRRWHLLTAAVGSTLLLHAVQGWCPPVPVLRRLGFRTTQEIEFERQALKALRDARADVGDRAAAALETADRRLH